RCCTQWRMTMAQEVLVSAVPLTLRIVRGRGKGELRILAEGFDPIEVKRRDKIILRPEGHGVVIERENVRRTRPAAFPKIPVPDNGAKLSSIPDSRIRLCNGALVMARSAGRNEYALISCGDDRSFTEIKFVVHTEFHHLDSSPYIEDILIAYRVGADRQHFLLKIH